MTANFDRWEKDPFFSAAEEVQESADRMESTYRTWLHSMKDASIDWSLEDLRRELCTALRTTKWQLEEFERAVQKSYKNNDTDEAKGRHRQFVLAMESKISLIQESLKDSAASDSKPSSPWIQQNEGEHDELALFLSGPTESKNKTKVQISGLNEKRTSSQTVDGKFSGHRRSASASADMSSWNIEIGDDELPSQLSCEQVQEPLRRAPSLSVFTESMEPALKPKFPKNGFRKLKPADVQQENDVALLRSQPQGRGNQASYERNKSYLSSSDDCYDKQLHSWYGALQRLLQRSLYHLQYIRSGKTMFLIALLLLSIVIFLVRVL